MSALILIGGASHRHVIRRRMYEIIRQPEQLQRGSDRTRLLRPVRRGDVALGVSPIQKWHATMTRERVVPGAPTLREGQKSCCPIRTGNRDERGSTSPNDFDTVTPGPPTTHMALAFGADISALGNRIGQDRSVVSVETVGPAARPPPGSGVAPGRGRERLANRVRQTRIGFETSPLSSPTARWGQSDSMDPRRPHEIPSARRRIDEETGRERSEVSRPCRLEAVGGGRGHLLGGRIRPGGVAGCRWVELEKVGRLAEESNHHPISHKVQPRVYLALITSRSAGGKFHHSTSIWPEPSTATLTVTTASRRRPRRTTKAGNTPPS